MVKTPNGNGTRIPKLGQAFETRVVYVADQPRPGAVGVQFVQGEAVKEPQLVSGPTGSHVEAACVAIVTEFGDFAWCGRVIDETMRFHATTTTNRLLTQAIDYRGVHMPAGTVVARRSCTKVTTSYSLPGANCRR